MLRVHRVHFQHLLCVCECVATGGVVFQQKQHRAQSAERRPTTAFASTILTQSVTQHNISPRSIRISRPRGPGASTSSSKHPFHNCLPSSAHRRQQARVYALLDTQIYIFKLSSDYVLCCIHIVRDGFVF